MTAAAYARAPNKILPAVRAMMAERQDEAWQKEYGRGFAEAVTGPAWPYISNRYESIARRVNHGEANRWAREYEPLVRHDLYLAAGDGEIKIFCDQRVTECERWIQAETLPKSLRHCRAVLTRYGMEWRALDCALYQIEKSEDGDETRLWPFAARLMCARWWRRQVRRLQCRVVDQYQRQRQSVAKYRQVYCSDWLVKNRDKAAKRNREALERSTAENSEGQAYTLAELADLGVSNPEIKRAELMTRIRGFEEVAQARGHVGEFWTFTAASRWHRMRWLKEAGKAAPVKAWNGSDPRAVQDWLCSIWAKIRAALDRAGIKLYGFRVVEPHHDGTPHWHLLVFIRECDRVQARKICRRYLWREDAPQEKNSWRHRFNAKRIDPAKGTASGYISKYIAKNIDGEGVRGSLYLQDDDSGLDMRNAAVRVRAWSAGYGIRQFQQIGGPSVTVWRELRRLWSAGEPGQGDLFECEEARDAGEAADCGDWAAYVEAMGGPLLPRSDRPVRPGYWVEAQYSESLDTATGEVLPVRVYRPSSQYGDTPKGSIFGLLVGALSVPLLTRFYIWSVAWCALPAKEDDQAQAPPGFAVTA